MFAILGSGFGLYGYLPALIDLGESVVLPERYRDRFNARSELARFASRVRWSIDEDTALAFADGAVLALRPEDQVKWIPRCLDRSGISRLMLEKPLAPTPRAAASLLNRLLGSGKAFRIGYMFGYTDWARSFRRAIQTTGCTGIVIRWTFLAHHFRHDLRNWKRSVMQGGGPIRFYGIQVIALLAELGYSGVAASVAHGTDRDDLKQWTAVFTGKDLPPCRIEIDAQSAIDHFQIEIAMDDGSMQNLVVRRDPFDAGPQDATSNGLDRRVGILSQLAGSLRRAEAGQYQWYVAAIALWRAAEDELKLVSAPGA